MSSSIEFITSLTSAHHRARRSHRVALPVFLSLPLALSLSSRVTSHNRANQTALSNKNIYPCLFPPKNKDTLVRSTSRDRRNQPPPRKSPAPRRMNDAPEFHASVEASGDPRVRIAATAVEEYESEKRPSRSRARVVRGAPVSSSERRSIRFDRWAISWRTFASCAPLANETRRDARIARATRGSRGTVFHASFARLASVESRVAFARGVRAGVNSRAASRPRRGAFERSLGTLRS